MKKITLLMMMAICFVGYSQLEVVQDFEEGGLGSAFGEGASAEIVADPETGGTNGNVAKLTATAGGAFFQGINISLIDNVDLTSNITMEIDAYSLEEITFAPKVVGGIDGAPDSTTAVTHTGSGWETLSFTFDQGLDNTTTANGVYTAFVVYYLWNPDTNFFIDPAIDREFFIDNIKGIPAEPVEASPPSTPAPTPPDAPDNEIINFYSDAYAQEASNFDAGFCGDNSVTEIQIEGNNTIAYNFNACQGIQLDSPKDASTFTTLNFDFYIDPVVTDFVGKVISLKFNQTNGPGPDDDIFLDIVLTDASNPPLSAGEWITLSTPVDLSQFDALDEFVITAGTLGGNLYYDNFYLSGGTLSNDSFEAANNFSVFPNPTLNSWNIKSASSSIQNVEIFNTLGKLVKTVSVNNSEASINASELPNGIYFAKIYSEGNQVSTIKLIKK